MTAADTAALGKMAKEWRRERGARTCLMGRMMAQLTDLNERQWTIILPVAASFLLYKPARC